MSRRRPLLEAAQAMLEGTPVDWSSLAQSSPEIRSQLEKLRLLESLAAACSGSSDEYGSGGNSTLTGESPTENASDVLIRATRAEASTIAPDPSSRAVERGHLFQWGPLEVRERVGAGGFGEVFRAFDPLLQREVALKLRRSMGEDEGEYFERHLDEARRLARIRHPNVVAVHGVETHGGRAGMWTDFLRGETLEDALVRDGPFRESDLQRAGVDLCRALAAVHDAGLVHGDVKTSNVMREPDGRVVLMDFGAGSDREPGSAIPEAQGTPLVLSPELLAGGVPSVASDLYALGVLLYRLATGRYPIHASSWQELLDAHLEREIVPLEEARPDLPTPFCRAIARLLAADPEDRPVTASELEMMLVATSDAVIESASVLHVETLPRFTTRFIGRRSDILALRRLLVDPGLVTLLGPGGCGKTRLAHRVVLDMASGLPRGAVWVDLAPVSSVEDAWEAVADALSVDEETDRPRTEVLLDSLSDRASLLVLDNCEHVTAAVTLIVNAIRSRCPGVRLLATSREPLGVPKERALRLATLELPQSGAASDPSEDRSNVRSAALGPEIGRYESVRLFVDRACRRQPEFVLTAANAPAVARIVQRVEGIPLAIELAAARVGALAVDEIAERLEQSFRLLAAETPSVVRHRTLEASIEWSYRLLGEEERMLLDRSSVFAGGFRLAAAETVCADYSVTASDSRPPGPRPESPDSFTVGDFEIVDLLGRLVDRSFVQLEEGGRYRLLDMVRSFAGVRLERSGDRAVRRDRHLEWCGRFAMQHDLQMFGPEQARAHAALLAERHNFRAAMHWALESPIEASRDPEAGLHLCLRLRRFWFSRGLFQEGLRHYTEQITRARPGSRAHGRTLVSMTQFYESLGQTDRAIEIARQALEAVRASGDEEWLPAALCGLGGMLCNVGDTDKGRSLQEEALVLQSERGNRVAMGTILSNLGVLEGKLGNLVAAEKRYEEALEIFREVGDEYTAGMVMRNLSFTAYELGDLARARRLGEESLTILRRSDGRPYFGEALWSLALIVTAEGDLTTARGLLLEALAVARATHDRLMLPGVIEAAASLEIAHARDERAATLLGAAESLREAVHSSLSHGERARQRAWTNALRDRLGEVPLATAWATGRAMTPDDAERFIELPKH